MRLAAALLILLLPVDTIAAEPARAIVKALAVGALKSATKPSGAAPKADDDATPKKGLHAPSTWKGLELRSIGPALTSGRVVDIAVDPRAPQTWYVAAAAGGLWKTVNAGTTWTPVFDEQKSWSIGCVTVDPNDSNVVWVGTGENNSQRVVAYGDGVYRSDDGGKNWTNVGLKTSEHISKIVVDPRDSKTVYVAAQGPLWSPGGERGLYKTTDAGKTWKPVLTISENTGVTDVVMDPRNPDVLLAAAYQRRRHVFTLIDGGPEAGIHKSTDAGATWTKVSSGLPKEDLGRIGLAISPVDPDTVYAVVEAANKAGGFFRSTDRGATWEKRSSYVPGGPQYYNELFADPHARDRVYSMDVWLQVTDDGGKTFRKLGEANKHPDNHAMWIDPKDPDHYVVGCDGGVYETFDRAETWEFKANLPITQFYRITADNSAPIYNVYGGTQDNFTLGGPSRTNNIHGIGNADWFVTWSGDGFVTAVDPTDPNIVYSEYQYGVLSRMDRRTGEAIAIQPQEGKGDEALRWNWDSPMIISPHKHTRLYFAANRVFRSDDRGDSWTAISGDLTRRIDRDTLEVMGRVWGPDAVAKNTSTSLYGNITQLAESPKQEGLIYVGTDDGLLQVTEDNGATWRRVERFPGVPETTLVSRVLASAHDANVVYTAFDNHHQGDFKPYALRSSDKGRTWTAVAGNLPQRGTVYSLAEDPVDRNLLFAGTEFGLYFTKDGGQRWTQLSGGLPPIQVRDLYIQARENDLVVGTFGRGIYILDDYTPLRHVTAADLEKDAHVFPPRAAIASVPASPLGLKGKSMLGDAHFLAPNPPQGAVFTYHLAEDLKTKAKRRRAAEKEAREKKAALPPYPSRDELRAEAEEEAPAVIATISDQAGRAVRSLTAPSTAGIHRLAWDLRYAPSVPTALKPAEYEPFSDPVIGPMVVPGAYTVSFARRVEGRLTPLGEPQKFEARGTAVPASQREALFAFQQKVSRLQRAALGAVEVAKASQDRIAHIKLALLDTAGADPALGEEARAIERKLRASVIVLEGDNALRARAEAVPPGIVDRVQNIVNSQWSATMAPTGTNHKAYDVAAEEFAAALATLRSIVEGDLERLEDKLEAAGAPWTPGRLPVWHKD